MHVAWLQTTAIYLLPLRILDLVAKTLLGLVAIGAVAADTFLYISISGISLIETK